MSSLRTPARLALIAFGVALSSTALPVTTAQAAGATTYYVSPSGNDSANGTSPGTAVKTLGRASGLQVNPGDSILLQSGATFAGKLSVWRNGSSASPITIGSYGSGAKPVVTGAAGAPAGTSCLELGASYITVSNVQVDNCPQDGIWSNGNGNVITGVEATHNIQGIAIGDGATNNKVLRSNLHNNDRMAPNTPGTFDDWGAVGVVVSGDNTEVAYNTITTNWAPSADFGTDGSAVEIYGGIGTSVHHNTAADNRTFTELGNKRSANTTFAYNQVTSSLGESEFLITRGDADYFGPVTGTVAVNNTVKLTGGKSLGFSCYAGCTPGYFSLYNNVLDVAGRIGYLEGSMSGGNNIYWHGQMGNAKMMNGDRYADPDFKGSNLVPTPKSPVVDAGRPAPMPTDLKGTSVGQDGNGDGVGGADIGAFEVKAKAGKKGHAKAKGKDKKGHKSKAKGKKDKAHGKHGGKKHAGKGKHHGAEAHGKGKRH